MIRFRRVPRATFLDGLSKPWFLASALFAAAVLLTYGWNRTQATEIVVCPWKLAFGLPCPFCGGTRSVVALAAGKVGEACHHNPLVALAAPLGLCWLLLRLIPGIKVETTLAARTVLAAILVLLALNWSYLLLR